MGSLLLERLAGQRTHGIGLSTDGHRRRLLLPLHGPQPGQDLVLLLEPLVERKLLTAQLLLLAGQLLAQLGRLPQDIDLGRPLLVPNRWDLFLKRLEQILETDTTLSLHIVVLIPLLDRVRLVQAVLWLLVLVVVQLLAGTSRRHARRILTHQDHILAITTTADAGLLAAALFTRHHARHGRRRRHVVPMACRLRH